MCSRNTVRESSVAGTLFVKLCGGWRTHTRIWQVCLSDQQVSPFTWETSGPLPFVLRPLDLSPSLEWPVDLCLLYKFTDLLLSFQVPCGSMNILFASRIFLFVVDYLKLQTFVFFPVFCWSYLRMVVSVTLSIENKLYSFSCETTFLVLSWDRIESAKFIVAS